MSLPESAAPLPPRRLWKSLSADKRTLVARAFLEDPQAQEHHAEATQAMAQHRHFRPQKIRGLPLETRARYLAATPDLSGGLILQALVSFHMECQRPMMVAFLDALGMPHEDGIIADEMTAPPPERLRHAAGTLGAGFPAEDVRLYFQTLLIHDPETWGGLAAMTSEVADTGGTG